MTGGSTSRSTSSGASSTLGKPGTSARTIPVSTRTIACGILSHVARTAAAAPRPAAGSGAGSSRSWASPAGADGPGRSAMLPADDHGTEAFRSALDVGLGPIIAWRHFVVPTAVLVLVLDAGRVPRYDLFLGRALRRSAGQVVGREGLGEHPIDAVGPTAVVLDDFIGNLGHACSCYCREGSLPP